MKVRLSTQVYALQRCLACSNNHPPASFESKMSFMNSCLLNHRNGLFLDSVADPKPALDHSSVHNYLLRHAPVVLRPLFESLLLTGFNYKKVMSTPGASFY